MDNLRGYALRASMVLEPLAVGSMAALALSIRSVGLGGPAALPMISALLAAQSWTLGAGREVRAALIAGAVLVPLAAHWDPAVAAVALAVILLQSSMVGFLGSLVIVLALGLSEGEDAGLMLLALGPVFVLAAGSLSLRRSLEAEKDLRSETAKMKERAAYAQRLNDRVLQKIASASYEQQNGDMSACVSHIAEAAEEARLMVESLAGEEDISS